jgi:uncharacterized membrane protein
MSDEKQTPETQPEEAQETQETQETQEAQPEAVAGVGLLIASFHGEDAGDQALKAMKEAKKAGQFYYEAAAVIKKEADGDVHYHENGDMSTGKGAGIGALIGGVVGILGGPAGIALGAGAGAAIGGLATHGDAGFRDSSLDQIGAALPPGSSAVMVITSKEFLKEFRKQVNESDIYPMLQAIGASIADAQTRGKDTLLGFVLTEEGVAVQHLAYDESTAEIFGLVATAEGVAAGEAYADESGVIYQAGVATDEGAAVEAGAITDEDAVVVDAVAVPVEEAVAEADAPVEEDEEEKPAGEEGEA